ncbi:MAG: MobF family relaxase [Mycobacteriales bacterium]
MSTSPLAAIPAPVNGMACAGNALVSAPDHQEREVCQLAVQNPFSGPPTSCASGSRHAAESTGSHPCIEQCRPAQRGVGNDPGNPRGDSAGVLSIGKLSVGQENYYLQTVARGVEDYYLGSGEAPGYWLGAGAANLELSGRVDAEQLRAVLGAVDPHSGDLLPVTSRRRNRLPGFDLTFSAPKSVSLLFALGGDDLAATVRAAHDNAVAQALGYLERQAGHVRRGTNGVDREAGGGFVAAGFRHRTSRAGDPHLHTHVLTANLIKGEDGRWSALDGRALYREAKTAGTLYRAALRHELRDLGLSWTMRANGLAEIHGVPATVLREFSRRRAEIEQALEARGVSSPRAAQVAALATRSAKDYGVSPESLAFSWHQRAEAFGFTNGHLRSLLGRTRPLWLGARERQVAADATSNRLLSSTGLTAHRTTFGRREALQAWCAEMPAGAPVSSVERLADELLYRSEVIPLCETETAQADRRYTTAEMLTTESAVIDGAAARLGTQIAVVDDTVVDAVLKRHPGLGREQVAMVRQLLRSGNGVDVVVGVAGSGKTSALRACAQAWRAAGHPVIGAALSARAASELHHQTGIPTFTVTRLLMDLDINRTRLAPGSVLAVDEAAMIGTRELARLVAVGERDRAKVVLVGDHHQLPEIDAGGAFRTLAARLHASLLTGNHRQAEGWERGALAQLRAGEIDPAIATYTEQGRVTAGENGDDVRRQMVTDWWADLHPAGSPRDVDAAAGAVMLAVRRRDVADLNTRARALMRAAGKLGSHELVVHSARHGERRFAVGDVTVALINDANRSGLVNGTRGVVVHLNAASRTVTVQTAAGAQHTASERYLAAGGLDHAYAVTVHKAQGMTTDRTYLLASDALYREAGYVGMSRGRISNRMYVVDNDLDETRALAQEAGHGPDEARADPVSGIVSVLNRSRAQLTATDHRRAAGVATTPVTQASCVEIA